MATPLLTPESFSRGCLRDNLGFWKVGSQLLKWIMPSDLLEGENTDW